VGIDHPVECLLKVSAHRLWLNDLRDRDPALADQIHLFSSFFYKKLAIKE